MLKTQDRRARCIVVGSGSHIGVSKRIIMSVWCSEWCFSFRRKEDRTWPLTIALGLLFLSSTLATAIRFPMIWDVFGWDPDRAARTAYMYLVLSCVNVRSIFLVRGAVRSAKSQYLISDMLVVWRAWVIWPDSVFVRGLLVASMSCSLGDHSGRSPPRRTPAH